MPYVHVIPFYWYHRFYASTSYRYAPLPRSVHPYSRSTHSSTSSCIVFVSIRRLRAFVGFNFVIESAGFDSLLIHLTSAISCYSYAWRRHITSIMSRFSCVVPSFTRHSYKDFEFIQTTSGRSISRALSTVDLTAALISKPCAMPYSSEASTLRVTLLHFVDD
jgi:hypothetical protein